MILDDNPALDCTIKQHALTLPLLQTSGKTTMAIAIETDDVTSEEIAAILSVHLDLMRSSSPACSVHALDLDKLRQPDITFWAAWIDGRRVGCVAMKEIDPTHGEIKSMRTSEAHRRRGVAARILEHIIGQARHTGIATLYLETGSMQEFAAARGLYERYGFEYCEPFGDYVEDPNSVFMRRSLTS